MFRASSSTNYSIRHIGANQAETLQSFTVLFSFVLAAAFLGEPLTLPVALGGLLVVAGSLFAEAGASASLRGGSTRIGVVCALLSSFVFAVVLALVRAGLIGGYPPAAAALISALFAFGFNAAIYDWRALRADLRASSSGALPPLLWAGVLIGAAQLLRYAASALDPLTAVSSIISVSPVLVVAFSRLSASAREVAKWRTLLSVALAAAGAVLVSAAAGPG